MAGKYLFGVVPAILFGAYYYKNKSNKFEMTLRGNSRMVVSFKHSFGIKVSSIYHTYDGEILDDSYSHQCRNLVIEKHTINDGFINDFPILSVLLSEEDGNASNFLEISKRVKQSTLKTHIKYSTLFSKNNELTLEWSRDGKFIYDIMF